jgi:hypothetical protein
VFFEVPVLNVLFYFLDFSGFGLFIILCRIMVTKGRDVKPMMLGHVHGKEGFLGSSDTTAIVGFIVATKVGSGVGVKSYSIMEQGRVDHILSLKPPERRILIEEVAGISIYEMRKKHSLNELEKTELRLKEAAAILRERNAYLRNLEDERKLCLDSLRKHGRQLQGYEASEAALQTPHFLPCERSGKDVED